MTSSAPVALITGGTSGIGEATALALVRSGYRVAVTSRDRSRLESLLQRGGDGDAMCGLQGSPTDPADVERWVEDCVSRFGRLDVAIANAGFAVQGDLLTADPTASAEMLLVNVMGPALLLRFAADQLEKSQGRLVILGSVGGHASVRGSLYAAAKSAVVALAENARQVLTERGVGVTLVSPGAVESEFWRDASRVPANALIPGRIAEAIVWAVGQPDDVDVSTVIIRPFGRGL